MLREIEVATKNQDLVFSRLKMNVMTCSFFIREGLLLRNNPENVWVLTKKCSIFKYKKAEMIADSFHIYEHLLRKQCEAFTTPWSSNIILNFIGCESYFSSTICRVSIQDIKCKMVAMKIPRSISYQYHFTPMLHTLN